MVPLESLPPCICRDHDHYQPLDVHVVRHAAVLTCQEVVQALKRHCQGLTGRQIPDLQTGSGKYDSRSRVSALPGGDPVITGNRSIER